MVFEATPCFKSLKNWRTLLKKNEYQAVNMKSKPMVTVFIFGLFLASFVKEAVSFEGVRIPKPTKVKHD